jgi:hypothetical protein
MPKTWVIIAPMRLDFLSAANLPQSFQILDTQDQLSVVKRL